MLISDESDDQDGSLSMCDLLMQEFKLPTLLRLGKCAGEIALRVAILKSALEDYMKFHNSPKCSSSHDLFQNAEEWIWQDDENGIFSFLSICALLGLDPDAVRRALIKGDVDVQQLKHEKPQSMVSTRNFHAN